MSEPRSTAAADRGHQLRTLVDTICRRLDAAGLYQIGDYRPEMASAICDVLYGNASVDLPSWPSKR